MAGTSRMEVKVAVHVAGAPAPEDVVAVALKLPDTYVRVPEDLAEGATARQVVHRSDTACARTRASMRSKALADMPAGRLPVQVTQTIPIQSDWVPIQRRKLHTRSSKRGVSAKAKAEGEIRLVATAWHSRLAQQTYMEVEVTLDIHLIVELVRETDISASRAEGRGPGVPPESVRVRVSQAVKLPSGPLAMSFDLDSAKPRPKDSMLNVDPDTCQVAQIVTVFVLISSLFTASQGLLVPVLPVLLLCIGLLCALVGFDRDLCCGLKRGK
jgi:hypothetical protein